MCYVVFASDHSRFLEIGVFKGDSLRTWADYFLNADIIGIDINPNCTEHANKTITIKIGSQDDREFLDKAIGWKKAPNHRGRRLTSS
jgi:cyclopropane fatty-acyl-phospholipid synthase-like methyltransferase